MTNVCEKFNTPNNSWEYIAPLPTPRHSLSLARNDFKKNLYAVGGIGGNQNFSQKTLSVIEEYNEVTGKWNKLQDMLSVRTGMRAVFNQYKNALFVLGGKSEVKGSVLRSVESFDSRSGQWNKWAEMIYARTFLVALFFHQMTFYVLVVRNLMNIKLLVKFLIFVPIDGGLPPL